MTQMRAGRTARAAIAAVITVLLAVVAHSAGHGLIPPLMALLPVVAAVFAIAYTVAHRRVSWWVILGLLGAAQTVVHFLSTYIDGAAHSDMAGSGIVMFLSHALSTVVTAALLAVGEKVWWRLRSWLDRRRPRVAPRPLLPLCYRVLANSTITIPVRLDVVGSVGVRGPPRRDFVRV